MRVHLVGIGGAGLSALAHVYAERGDVVSGSDATASPTTDALAADGVRVAVGHDAANLGDADTVVVSTAIPEDNPEVVESRRRGLRVLHRSLAVAELVRGRRVVAVAGTHGKTTTTTMVAAVLEHLDPLVLSGGRLPGSVFNSRPGRGSFAVVEADESDGSFLQLTPEVAIVTNVEADHLDRYRDLDEVRRAFELFGSRVTSTLAACVDDPGARALLEAAPVDTISYGFGPADVQGYDYRPGDGGCRFDLSTSWGRALVDLPAGGRHNALNAMAAVAAGLALHQPLDGMVDALRRVTLPGRRMELVAEVAGARVYDDYGHHPTEVRATLEGARELGTGLLVCAFQPHMHTRLAAFMEEFADALSLADVVLLAPVYAARDQPIPGVDSEALAAAIRRRSPGKAVTVVPSLAELPSAAREYLRPAAVLVFMGAGDIYKASRDLAGAAA